MKNRTQKIGNISGSKDIDLKQSSAGGAEQEIGNIEDSERVKIIQEALQQEINNLVELGDWILAAPDGEKKRIVTKLQGIIIREAGDQNIDSHSIDQVVEAHLPESVENTDVGSALRDAASALSLVSGTIAVSMVTNPLLLAVAIPATLAFTGILQKDQLARIYRKAMSLRSSND